MAEIITSECGCSVDWHKNNPLQSKINYCPKHVAIDDVIKALTYMLEVWYLQKTKEFDIAREKAQAALALTKRKQNG